MWVKVCSRVWRSLDVVAFNGLVMKEIKQLLKDTVWRGVRAEWKEGKRAIKVGNGLEVDSGM